ncbi:MAG: DUF4397 domain-containing protein [Gemmatimonadaceae bacterium]|nr:DUF4397 domain-containing protein [Gemmatimonadaceae bacterium]
MTSRSSLLRRAALVLGTIALAACEKNAVQDITGSLPESAVKFFNFSVNGPQVNFYANDTKVTAITSTTGVESTLGVAYGSAGLGGLYSAINPGQYTFSGRIAATVDKDLPIARINGSLAANRAYSVYLSGFYDPVAKTTDGFILEDVFPATFDFTQAYVRFVHAIANAGPLQLVARNTTTNAEVSVAASVTYKAGSAFVPVPAGVYDLNARLAGQTANAFTRTAVNFVAGRVYTIGARGDITVTSTTAVNRPFLDNTANR